MKTPDQITTRELLREYPKQMYRVARGETITVTKNGKPFYDIIPRVEQKAKTGKDYLHLAGIIKSKEKNLSMQVDKILYGAQ